MTLEYQFLNAFATIMPNYGFKNQTIFGDDEIFFDRDYVWGSLPKWLKGKTCLQSMLSTGSDFTVTESGWLYILTPEAGNSTQLEAMRALGFEVVTYLEEGVMAKGISGRIAVMGQFVESGFSFTYPGAWVVILAEIDEGYEGIDPREWSMIAPVPVAYPGDKLAEHPEYLEYLDGERKWQGIASMAKDDESGRLWATWYTGGTGEGSLNYVVLYTSADDGKTWSGPALVVDPTLKHVRAFDPNLWMDPDGRMWLFWTQSFTHSDGRFGVWAICTEDPGSASPTWSDPVRIANGVGMCDPLVLTSSVGDLPAGTWLFPAAVWDRDYVPENLQYENHPNCYVSYDKGATWSYYSSVPSTEAARTYDENMIVQNSDGTLTMYIRTDGGIEKSTSADGKTWTPAVHAGITLTSARFWVGTLEDGVQLCVYNAEGRRQMTAALSYDDGKTWTHKLLIYTPYSIYPDVHIDDKGNIYIITCEDPKTNMKINMAKITKADIVAGAIVTPGSYLRTVINDNTKCEVSALTLSKTSATIELSSNKALFLIAYVTFSNNNNNDAGLVWTSSDESVATVDGEGKVTVHAEGEVTITVTAKDGTSATCKITVK